MKKTALNQKYCIGLNKGLHHASVCLSPVGGPPEESQIFLKERFTRIKGVGSPIDGLLAMPEVLESADEDGALIAESSYGERPALVEDELERKTGYFKLLETLDLRRKGLLKFFSRYNPEVRFLSHHYCHARAAAALSPYSKALILVADGVGSNAKIFDPGHREISGSFAPAECRYSPTGVTAESVTVYLQERSQLRCVHKEWQQITKSGLKPKSDGLGALYAWAASYIFNSGLASGKVMGLAAYGTPAKIKNRADFFERLGWDKSFKGVSKEEWEQDGKFRFYADAAASVQSHFEESLLILIRKMKDAFPDVGNLILTGGCALNCVANMKAFDKGLFSSIYVPPFPGDESISFGAAQALRADVLGSHWAPLAWERQVPNFGPEQSAPTPAAIKAAFKGMPARELGDPADAAARLLAKGKIVGWFQGRSESGPRALGCRSILAAPGTKGLRDDLNRRIKKRESFRPYGCSVLWERAHEYFAAPRGFESPFMSFAPAIRAPWREALSEVAHIDGTSRIQTVRAEQNPLFHRLIEKFGLRAGTHCVLNTSLNVAGEPLAETLADLRRFFESAPVDCVIAGNILIQRA
ncbi:MAG TPA: carbamoyltransferase C-terminal domain-containing protein [Elusimicrobiota bacterium]|nr:carbamoyltransferase C-terminal domain-containing protein [Elusimicrobiota bacterium]